MNPEHQRSGSIMGLKSCLPALALAVMSGSLYCVRSEVESLAQPGLTAPSLAAIASEAQRVAVPIKELSESPGKNLTAGLQLPNTPKTSRGNADWSSVYNFTDQAIGEQIGQSTTNPRANSWRCRGSTPLAAVPFCGLPFAATNSYGKSPSISHSKYVQCRSWILDMHVVQLYRLACVPVELLTTCPSHIQDCSKASKSEGALIMTEQTSIALNSHLPAAGMHCMNAVGQIAGLLACSRDCGKYCWGMQDDAGVIRGWHNSACPERALLR